MIVLEPGTKSPVSELLIDVLVCPEDQADLVVEGNELVCTECGARYEVSEGVPNMLPADES